MSNEKYVTIRITKCSFSSYWYAGLVGSVFRVLKSPNNERMVLDKDSFKSILTEDCEIVSEQDYLTYAREKELEEEKEREKQRSILLVLQKKMGELHMH